MTNRHFPSANKEWINSAYKYNKSGLVDSRLKDNLADKIIKGHFNLINVTTRLKKAKNMRNLIIRKSSRKIVASKPYIKQNNDKNNFTVFVYNRQNQYTKRKLFFLQRKLFLYNLWSFNNFNRKKSIKINDIYSLSHKDRFYTNDLKKLIAKRKNNNIYHSSGIKFKNELDFFKDKITDINIYYRYMKNIIIYRFLLHIISTINNNSIILHTIKNKYMSDKTNTNSKITLDNLYLLNKGLLYYIEKNIIDKGIINRFELKSIYDKFKDRFFKKLLDNTHKKDIEVMSHLSSLQLNNLKYTSLLQNLKIYLGKIYNNNANINIINLKYPFLDSDVYTQLITSKAKKKISFLRVLTSSIRLAKVPSWIFSLNRPRYNRYDHIRNYKEMFINKYKTKLTDHLSDVIVNLFPKNFINNQLKNNNSNSIFYKTNEVLNTIKFKWVNGARIEGAGRLTRRYTASRSAYKFKYRGNLRYEVYVDDYYGFRQVPVVMLRNTDKSNLQYSFQRSVRRIGAFGIKNWISSY